METQKCCTPDLWSVINLDNHQPTKNPSQHIDQLIRGGDNEESENVSSPGNVPGSRITSVAQSGSRLTTGARHIKKRWNKSL